MEMTPDRRGFIGASAMLAATAATAPVLGAKAGRRNFPKNFMWGSATAGHQVEGNNFSSDAWLLENVKPTIFAEPSADAANSFALWATDLDLAKSLGFNTYRFSLEWARIEPEQGLFSIAMLDHYKRIVDGCLARDLTPFVTYNHFVTPRWFAAMGGWENSKSPELFARFCERATRHLGGGIGYALTLNEPNLPHQLAASLPEFAMLDKPYRATMAAAAKAINAPQFSFQSLAPRDIAMAALPNIIAGHKAGRVAIKSVRPDLPVGVSLAVADEQSAGGDAKRDAVREEAYGAWLDAVHGDDFLGVQNYARNVWGPDGKKMPPPPGAMVNASGTEVHPPSMAEAVRYAHSVAGCPIIVTEHGVSSEDDNVRAALITGALAALKNTMDDGVPVLGYLHWSLIDNFEWIFGYKPKFGLCSVDRTTFKRTPKPSAYVLGSIAKRNRL